MRLAVSEPDLFSDPAFRVRSVLSQGLSPARDQDDDDLSRRCAAGGDPDADDRADSDLSWSRYLVARRSAWRSLRQSGRIRGPSL